MSSVNKVIIVGRLGNDPEVKHFSNGGQATNISVATSEQWKDKQGQKQERTEWHRIVFYGRLAEIAEQYLQKGSLVYVEGSLHTRHWQDQSGVDRYTTEIKSEKMVMLGKAGGNSAPNPTQSPKQIAAAQPIAQNTPTQASKFNDWKNESPATSKSHFDNFEDECPF